MALKLSDANIAIISNIQHKEVKKLTNQQIITTNVTTNHPNICKYECYIS